VGLRPLRSPLGGRARIASGFEPSSCTGMVGRTHQRGGALLSPDPFTHRPVRLTVKLRVARGALPLMDQPSGGNCDQELQPIWIASRDLVEGDLSSQLERRKASRANLLLLLPRTPGPDRLRRNATNPSVTVSPRPQAPALTTATALLAPQVRSKTERSATTNRKGLHSTAHWATGVGRQCGASQRSLRSSSRRQGTSAVATSGSAPSG